MTNNHLCKITKRVKDNKYEVHLFVGKLHFGVCDDKDGLIKNAKKALVDQICANEKESNLLQKDIDNALSDLDRKLDKLKRIN